MPSFALRLGRDAAALDLARRYVLPLSALGTVVALGVALLGTWTVDAEVPKWPRFWATAYFVLLLWPIGLSLAGYLAGLRVQVLLVVVALVATALQQISPGTMPLPLAVRWYVSLVAPGDAIRQRILLPDVTDREWLRAQAHASRAAVVICTEKAVPLDAGVTVTLNGGPAVPLASLKRRGRPDGEGWYELPIAHEALQGTRMVEVVVQQTSSEGGPGLLCGGQDDPRRRGAGGSARWLNGRWSDERLADQALPFVDGRPAPGRYYIELRFYDPRDMPTAGIWY